MSNNIIENISCLHPIDPRACDFCDARCPYWVDKNFIKEFLLNNMDYLHKTSLEKLEATNGK